MFHRAATTGSAPYANGALARGPRSVPASEPDCTADTSTFASHGRCAPSVPSSRCGSAYRSCLNHFFRITRAQRLRHGYIVLRRRQAPPGKILIPGVMDTVTSFVEHPESVAKRIVRYAKRVGRENVIAAPDCGFGTFGGWNPESTPRSCGPSSARWSRVPESQRRNSGAKPARRSCTHLYPPISFSYPLHNVAFSLALISPRMPHTMIKSTGSTIRLPVPLQPGRVRATTPVPCLNGGDRRYR